MAGRTWPGVTRIALAVASLGAAALVLILVASLLSTDAAALPGAMALVVSVIAAAAAAAVAYRATDSLRNADGFAPILSWMLVSCSPVAVFLILARVSPAVFSLTRSTATHVHSLAAPGTALLVLFSSVVAGLLIHRISSGNDEAPLFVRTDEDLGPGTLAKWLAVILTLYLCTTVAGRRDRLDLPSTPSSAAKMAPHAEADAMQYPRNARAQFVYGITLMELDQFDTATATLRRALALDADNAHANNAIGWMAMNRRRFPDAVPYLNAAIALDSGYGHAWHNLGWALSQTGKYAEAANAYQNAVRLKPEDAKAAAEYSWVLRLLNQRDLALQQMLRAVGLQPTNVRYRSVASELLRNNRRFAEAIAYLEDAIKISPSNASLWGELALTHYLMKNAGAAVRAFDKAQELDSNYLSTRPLFSAMYRAARRGSTADVNPADGVRVAIPVFQ